MLQADRDRDRATFAFRPRGGPGVGTAGNLGRRCGWSDQTSKDREHREIPTTPHGRPPPRLLTPAELGVAVTGSANRNVAPTVPVTSRIPDILPLDAVIDLMLSFHAQKEEK